MEKLAAPQWFDSQTTARREPKRAKIANGARDRSGWARVCQTRDGLCRFCPSPGNDKVISRAQPKANTRSRRKESANEHHRREQSSFSIFHISRRARDFNYLDRFPVSREQRVQSTSKASDKAKRTARQDHRATERNKQSAAMDRRQLELALLKIGEMGNSNRYGQVLLPSAPAPQRGARLGSRSPIKAST